MTENISQPLWRGHPCEKYVERLILALNTDFKLRKTPKGWIPRRSHKKYSAWMKDNNIQPPEHKHFTNAVRVLHVQYRTSTGEKRNQFSRYFAIKDEWLCNFDQMQHFVGLTTPQRSAIRTLARDNLDILHTLAVAQLYCTATRCLGKEVNDENEQEGA